VSSGKKTNKKRSSRTSKKSVRKKEIWGISLMAIALLLLVSLWMAHDGAAEGIGVIGSFLATVMTVLAGHAAYAFPIFLLIFGFLMFTDRHRRVWGLRFGGLIMVFLSCLGLLHLTCPADTFMNYIVYATQDTGGGLLGGLISFVMRTAFGQIGSIIVFIALAVIGVMMLTEVSLFALINKTKDSLGDAISGLGPANDKEEKGKKTKPILLPLEHGGHEEVPIYSHDDPAPLIGDNKKPKTINSPPPTPFAKEFMPDVSGIAKKEAAAASVAAVKEQPVENVIPFPSPPEEGESVIAAPVSDEPHKEYILPSPELISCGLKIKNPRINKAITDGISVLEQTLENFGVKAKVTQVVNGPTVTRYELQPAPGVKVSRITSLADDIALVLAASDVRIEAPIPGKSAIGIEVPRSEIATIYFRELVESEEFIDSPSKISLALGKNIGGKSIVGDLSKMPHMLIAGATGSGKSICINTMICSILFKAKPDEVKLMLIDPKKVEMTHYKGLPHLYTPVITDPKKASASLKMVVNEMENRYSLFAGSGTKDFEQYNSKHPESPMNQIVVIIDELADLMMVAKSDVEDSICRLAQLARAAGIHLIVATQRPSVDVLTGLIKANIPSRIAFAVSSHIDSRTILDMGGAEKLLGRGDMLYHPAGAPKPMRVQGSYIENNDIQKLVDYCAAQASPRFQEAAANNLAAIEKSEQRGEDEDILFVEAAHLIISTGQASTSFLQRRFRIGNPRAGRLIDILEAKGVVSGPDGAKPRNVLMTMDEFDTLYVENE